MDPARLVEWLSGTPEPWQIFLAVVFLGFLIADKVGNLRSTWINLRLGRDELSLEKQRLEVEKLRYEIEAIRKTHALPELAPTPAPTVEREKQAVREEPAAQPPPGWRLRHPVLATLLLRAGQVILAWLGITFGLSGVVMPFVPLFDTTPAGSTWAVLLFGAFIYLFLAYGCYRGFLRLQRSVVSIRMHGRASRPGPRP